MGKKIFITLFFVTQFSSNLFSIGTRTLTIQDSITHKPIPYVNAYFGNLRGTYADESGIVEVPDSVTILYLSHISYEKKEIQLKLYRDNIILLRPADNNLPEISVLPSQKNNPTEFVGLFKEKIKTSYIGVNGFFAALYIPYKRNRDEFPYYIQSIMANFRSLKVPQKGGKLIPAKLRFDLRLPDKETQAPTEYSLIEGGIIYDPGKKNGVKEINLPTPILFPEEGIFIVVEWISSEHVKNKDLLIPCIGGVTLEDECNTWIKRSFRGEDWILSSKDKGSISFNEMYLNGKTGNLAVGLKLLYENDK